MTSKTLLTALSACASLCTLSSVNAQIAGDNYFAAPAIGNAGGFAFSGNMIIDSTIDGASEVVGTTLATMDPIDSVDTIVSNGGGNFVLTLRVSSVGDVSPGGFTLGGVPADIAGFFLGANAGGSPVNFTRVAMVNTATISILDLTGAVAAGPFDVAGFANFSDPAFGGGWDGSLGVTFGAGSAGGIGGYELIVDYNEGAILGTFETSGMGCPAAAPVNLSVDVLPAINSSFTVNAADLPANTVAASLLFGSGLPTNLPLDLLGATGCTLLVDNIFTAATMAIAGTDATFTAVVPNDPATVGLSLNVQAGAIAPGANALGLVLSDLGIFSVGG